MKPAPLPIERIENRILFVRGQKVLLDTDLAGLYGVETRALNQAVKRNLERFPTDFMFQRSAKEFENWRSQIVMSKPGAKMGLRRAPSKSACMSCVPSCVCAKARCWQELRVGN